MKQQPSRLNFKKYHKFGKAFFQLKEQKVFFPAQGNYCIKVLYASHITLKQIEACRKSIRRSLRKKGVIKIRIFTHHSMTKKSVGSRMGKGKGAHSTWVCPVRAGQVVCELSCLRDYKSLRALQGAGSKLPVKVKVTSLKYQISSIMVQMGTILRVTDKTCVVSAQCIKVLGHSKQRIACLGDLILVSIQWVNSKKFARIKARLQKKYLKGMVHRASITRSTVNVERIPGIRMKFDENAVVLVTARVVPVSNRIYGPILRETCERWPSIGCVSHCIV